MDQLLITIFMGGSLGQRSIFIYLENLPMFAMKRMHYQKACFFYLARAFGDFQFSKKRK